MSQPSFNLVDQPWIPCMTTGGRVCVLSLSETFMRAHELRAIHANPPTTAALMRMMIAVIHRVLDGPKNDEEWADAWQKGKFDHRAVQSYLKKWQGRFDLFDQDYPFFQVHFQGDMIEKPPSLLDFTAAAGNNPTLFDHSMDDSSMSMSAAEAARWLVTIQAFDSCGLMSGDGGGRISSKAGLLAGSWVFFVTGKSLFHTLLLNTPIYDPLSSQPFPCSDKDAPVWEREPSSVEETQRGTRERTPEGWLDLLTYPSRRVELIADSNVDTPRVCRVKMTEGDRPHSKWTLYGREMFVAFVQHKKYGLVPLRPEENRDLWRDATVLINTKLTNPAQPLVLKRVARLVTDEKINGHERLGLDAYAIATNQSSYLYWRHERLPLRTALFHLTDIDEKIDEAIDGANQVADHLQRAVAVLAGRPYGNVELDSDERERRKRWAERAMGEFWARLGPGFDNFLNVLPDNDRAALCGWCACLERAIDAVWSLWTTTIPVTPAAFHRAAQAEQEKRKAFGEIRRMQEEVKSNDNNHL